MKAVEIAKYIDDLLNVSIIRDASLNGLQVENQKDIKRIALAVDASLATITKAKAAQADMLIVHHGLYWGKPLPITGMHYNRIKRLIDTDMALYAVHLPLDVHSELGNNVQIAKTFGWEVRGEFGIDNGMPLGIEVRFKIPQSILDIADVVNEKLNIKSDVWDFGPTEIRKMGIVSGGGIVFLEQAKEYQLDALLTGEPKHSAYWPARELGMNVLLAGHYATETLGLKALGRYLKSQLDLQVRFVDLPTGY
jgi:dinuclear metal center YbgI/SA1388 family protein